jgi:hypothetical protein
MEEEQDIMPPNMETLSYSSAFRLFALEKRAGMLLGSSKVIYDTRNLQESGKGVEYQGLSFAVGRRIRLLYGSNCCIWIVDSSRMI